jgi:hypothetical protein
MSIRNFIESLEEEILDPEEGTSPISTCAHPANIPETFFLFSQPIPSANLGFVDPKASELDITIRGRDYTIHQSPAVLASNREGGTTGAGWSPAPRSSASY